MFGNIIVVYHRKKDINEVVLLQCDSGWCDVMRMVFRLYFLFYRMKMVFGRNSLGFVFGKLLISFGVRAM